MPHVPHVTFTSHTLFTLYTSYIIYYIPHTHCYIHTILCTIYTTIYNIRYTPYIGSAKDDLIIKYLGIPLLTVRHMYTYVYATMHIYRK